MKISNEWIDYKIIDGLHERKAGLWAGLTFEQIEEKYNYDIYDLEYNLSDVS